MFSGGKLAPFLGGALVVFNIVMFLVIGGAKGIVETLSPAIAVLYFVLFGVFLLTGAVLLFRHLRIK